MEWRARIAIEVSFEARDPNEAHELLPTFYAATSFAGYPITAIGPSIYVAPVGDAESDAENGNP